MARNTGRTGEGTELRERVRIAMRDAGAAGRDEADAMIAAFAGFAADALDDLGGKVEGIGSDDHEYGRALGIEESAGFLRGLAA
jgi:hypothetical protein